MTTYAYDNLSRLQSVLHQLSGSTIDGASYGLDSAGNRTSKTDQRVGVTSNYAYDPIYELTSVTQAANTTESYTYDAAGNRLSSLGVSPYSVNPSNELTSTPNTTYTYDNNGNTTSKTDSIGTTNYTWDFENRLVGVTLPGNSGTITFNYDPFGRRVRKSITSGTTQLATTATNYLYDGLNLIEEVDPNGIVLTRYEQGQNIDEPLAQLRSGVTSYYEMDGLGSVTSLSNSAGTLAQSYAFDSFGRQTASSGSVANPFRYAAREFDSETGLYFMRARYYDPATGRFLSEDPFGSVADLNLYKYVGNNAPNFYDPLGLFELKTTITKFQRDLWDPTNWGFGNTTVEVNANGECICDGKNGYHISYKLNIISHVQYSSQSSLKHGMEHISIAEAALKRATPELEAFEKPHYSSKPACERDLQKKILGGPGSDLDDLLNSLAQRFSEEQSEPEPWYQRLWRKIFFPPPKK